VNFFTTFFLPRAGENVCIIPRPTKVDEMRIGAL
jgi:hypothetical protein